MPLIKKIAIFFLFIGPLAIASKFQAGASEQAITKEAFQNLETIRLIRTEQVKGFFNDHFRLLDLLGTSPRVMEALNGQRSGHDTWLSDFQNATGIEDLFLINREGVVIDSARSMVIQGRSLQSGPLQQSGLGRLYQRIEQSASDQRHYVEEVSLFAQAKGQPALFIAAPIYQQKQRVGTLAIQLPYARLNALMQQKVGLGNTGETFLLGSDKKMRSDSRLQPKLRSVKASLEGSVEKNGVDTTPAKKAIAGESGLMENLDVTRSRTYSSYGPVDVPGLKWIMVAEIDRMEVQMKMIDLRVYIFLVVSLTALIMTALLLFKGRKGGTNNWRFP
ncbi:MAG: cache domain-containing protein [Magnetococcales bacterium]|nr:cache domain-containing protein [Magnetococcales bacterium]